MRLKIENTNYPFFFAKFSPAPVKAAIIAIKIWRGILKIDLGLLRKSAFIDLATREC